MSKPNLGFGEPFKKKPKLPHKYSVEIGQKIREARLEHDLTQEELAEAIYKRRASLSDIENGKMLPDAFTLVLISNRLGKSLDYFAPGIYRDSLEFLYENLSSLEKDLISQFRRISDHRWQKMILKLVTDAADYEFGKYPDLD